MKTCKTFGIMKPFHHFHTLILFKNIADKKHIFLVPLLEACIPFQHFSFLYFPPSQDLLSDLFPEIKEEESFSRTEKYGLQN